MIRSRSSSGPYVSDIELNALQEVEGEFFFAKGVDGTTTEEIQVALEDSIKGNVTR